MSIAVIYGFRQLPENRSLLSEAADSFQRVMTLDPNSGQAAQALKMCKQALSE